MLDQAEGQTLVSFLFFCSSSLYRQYKMYSINASFKNNDGSWRVSNKYSRVMILLLPADADATSGLNALAGYGQKKRKIIHLLSETYASYIKCDIRNKNM